MGNIDIIQIKSNRLLRTRVGQFLKQSHPSVFDQIVSLPANDIPNASVLKTIFSKIPGLDMSSRTAFSEKVESYDLELAQMEPIQELPKVEPKKDGSGWLNNNVIPLIAILWTLFTCVLYLLALHGDLHSKENMQLLVVNTVTNVVMLIVGYYFGSSQGSKKKSEDLSNVVKKG